MNLSANNAKINMGTMIAVKCNQQEKQRGNNGWSIKRLARLLYLEASTNTLYRPQKVGALSFFATLLLLGKIKTAENQSINSRFVYPEPIVYPVNIMYPKEAKCKKIRGSKIWVLTLSFIK